MKKVLYLLISAILFSGVVAAQESNINFNQLLQTTAMPSDGEILQIIEMLGVTQEEKEELLKETKIRLEQMYKTNDTSALIETYQTLPNIQKTERNLVAQPPKLKDRPKKYSSHPPLTNKRK